MKLLRTGRKRGQSGGIQDATKETCLIFGEKAPYTLVYVSEYESHKRAIERAFNRSRFWRRWGKALAAGTGLAAAVGVGGVLGYKAWSIECRSLWRQIHRWR